MIMGTCRFCAQDYEGTLEDHLNKIHTFDPKELAKYFAVIDGRLISLEVRIRKFLRLLCS